MLHYGIDVGNYVRMISVLRAFQLATILPHCFFAFLEEAEIVIINFRQVWLRVLFLCSVTPRFVFFNKFLEEAEIVIINFRQVLGLTC